MTKKEIIKSICKYDFLKSIELNDDITVGEALEAMQLYADQQTAEKDKRIKELEDSSNEVWGFFYNENVHESVPGLVSLHHTQKGAEMAMEFHKAELRKEYDELWSEYEDPICKFGEHESWNVEQIKINQ
jgi:hypothetical protein